jgi:hypothetical protein
MDAEDMKEIYDGVQVGLARKGRLGKFLAPALWEDLRIQLQNEYRRATGETQATLIVTDPAAAIRSMGEKGADGDPTP